MFVIHTTPWQFIKWTLITAFCVGAFLAVMHDAYGWWL